MDNNNPPTPEAPQAETPTEPNIIAQAAAEAPAETTPAFPAEPTKPKNSKKLLLIVLIILLVAILGVAVWFLFFKQPTTNNKTTNNSNTTTPEITEDTDDPEASTIPEIPAEPETTLVDTSAISPLFRQILILHHPGIDNYLSSTSENYVADQRFSFGSAYAVSDRLYTSGLTNSDKLYIATQYMRGKKMLKPASEYGLPADYYASVNPDYCAQSNDKTTCESNDWISAASEDEVSEVYYSIFGEKPTSFDAPTVVCGALFHSVEYHVYFTPFAGCGGFDGPQHQAYVEKYAESENYAYVYLRIASIDIGSSDNVPVYKTFIGISDLYDSNTQQNITPDESLVYSYLGAGGMGMYIPLIINAENASEFSQYRFVFQKDSDNYYFKTVEKL